MTADDDGFHDAREERLAEILMDCSDRLDAGHTVDFAQVVTEHPGLAPELPAALDALLRFAAKARPVNLERDRLCAVEALRRRRDGGIGDGLDLC